MSGCSQGRSRTMESLYLAYVEIDGKRRTSNEDCHRGNTNESPYDEDGTACGSNRSEVAIASRGECHKTCVTEELCQCFVSGRR